MIFLRFLVKKLVIIGLSDYRSNNDPFEQICSFAQSQALLGSAANVRAPSSL